MFIVVFTQNAGIMESSVFAKKPTKVKPLLGLFNEKLYPGTTGEPESSRHFQRTCECILCLQKRPQVWSLQALSAGIEILKNKRVPRHFQGVEQIDRKPS